MFVPHEVDQCAAQRLDDPVCARDLRDALGSRGLLLFPPGAVQSEADLQVLAGVFGELQGSLAIDETERRAPRIQRMHRSDRGQEERVPSSYFWHVDRSFLEDPPVATALRAVIVAEGGGETQFADMSKGLEILEAESGRLDGIQALHSYSRYANELQKAAYSDAEREAARARYSDVWHPLVMTVPFSESRSIYLSELCISEFRGSAPSSNKMNLDEMVSACTQPDNVYTHRWSPGEVLVWNNVRMMHRGRPSSGERLLQRAVSGSLARGVAMSGTATSRPSGS